MMKNKLLFLIPIIIGIGCNVVKNKVIIEYELSKDTLAFNVLKFTDTLNFIIHLKNYSKSELKILQIENGCGCTSALLIDSTAKANDSIPIQITYSPFKVHDSGRIVKYITFRTNGAIPFKNLVIKGLVKK